VDSRRTVSTRTARRLESVDFLRGVVMILMALDHVREFFGDTTINPTDPATTTVALFFTRWMTHFCAPVFFLLTGTGAALALRGRSVADLSRFLLVRGIWLIVLEIVVVRWAMQFNVDYHVTLLTVFWVLGCSMIVLAILVRLPPTTAGVIGIVIIATHNLLDRVRPSSFGSLAPLWTLLHSPGVALSASGHIVFAAYPLIPWIGVAAAGYGLGHVYRWTPDRRQTFLWRVGIVLTALFVVLRAVNGYGDPLPWAVSRRSVVFTALSFLNTSKYPPSLLFLLMTLGPALCVLAAVDRRVPTWLRPAVILGKVPLYYYVLHLLLIHAIAVIVCAAKYGAIHWMVESPTLDRYPFTRPPGWGFGLPVVYLIWIVVLLLMYPMCRWFAGVRERRRDRWLRFV
jgi:uncharacterized membrane protein